ncbi:hypothetical protein BCR32DRAFT_289885 [Anaeromyces robustus]|uniref:CBM10 domain-containing protein n=1 Tax=Anaeromyces robustus TaxID=1754192 RepID=A0A1Y1XLJ6_9FUNG|nr:hypothetical protein BCR32DRAFT_289885 [Anaeromyces robustus]|eukprot:ORX86575.1 hypothetical protein BCR32DRAFT_289885 [Anaeromyces robustus]
MEIENKIYGVLSINTFIEKGQRAQLFEIMDNEIPNFKVTISNDDFELLKDIVNYKEEKDTNIFESIKGSLKNYISILLSFNYIKTFPGYDFNKILPELNIDNDGFPHLDNKETFDGFDINPDHYNKNDKDIEFKILSSNPNFNLLKNLNTVSNLNRDETVYIQPVFLEILKIFKNVDTEKYNAKNIKRNIQNDDNTNNNDSNNNDNDDDVVDKQEFKTKNATLAVEINGETKDFEKITLKLGGVTSRNNGKPPLNIKIRGNKDLYDRSQFKLRADDADPTFLRTKLVADIHNRLGIPSISSSYVNLYINNENMGLYVLNDAYKLSWIKSVYGEDNTTSLYKCDNLAQFTPTDSHGCENENEDDFNNDYTELDEFLKLFREAKTVSELENIFEIDHFLTEMAIDYLLGSWDHVNCLFNEHNFYLYKQPNGKWIYLTYDYNYDFGMIFGNPFGIHPIHQTFYEYIKKLNIFDNLIFNDPTRFENILKQVVEKVFNPATLYPHIDEIKHFIKPNIKLDKTPNAQGQYPGRLNNNSMEFYNFEEWDANSEFTPLPSELLISYGLKYWVLARYRFVCQYYHMDCDPVYMDKDFKYSINKNVELVLPDFLSLNITYSPDLNNGETQKCWSELIGYKCCAPNVTAIYASDEYGYWGYDFENNEWCGITTYTEKKEKSSNDDDDNCWSQKYGYPCCQTCIVYHNDNEGSWGYEYNGWCGIPTHCNENNN